MKLEPRNDIAGLAASSRHSPQSGLLRLGSRLLPCYRRREWLDEWEGELWALAREGAGGWALVRFALGGVAESVWERYREEQLMGGLVQDVRHACRRLVRGPVFSVAVVVVLAFGIGATTAVFSVADRLLLSNMPGIQGADRVVEIGRTRNGEGFDSFTYPNMLALRESATPFAQVAGWSMNPMSVATVAGGQRVLGMTVSWNYFAALGLEPTLGRWFLAQEDATPGTHPVAVISHRFWQEDRKSVV